eukprot:COSAG06_NODE_3944_length_4740_cov_2.176255_2_plen_147_part_00
MMIILETMDQRANIPGTLCVVSTRESHSKNATATEWRFDEFCAQTSTHGAKYGTAVAGVAADLAEKVIGDIGGLIMARLITPPDSRGNTLFIGGQLRGFNAGPLTELVVICIYEELVTMDMADMDFAPPQECCRSAPAVFTGHIAP